ncbi:MULTISPECIES: polyhydroxyalkanoic acid system family protein [Nannocystis]|uniref:Polyhydroxyalkanoic acid system family protein n=1 Tax=Nannocystis radixulma TaxID=2995305 RepID=A0ABT5BGC8_9BACT|nr:MULTISPECIES: polyhydroxyalkanoic acid system family protein [Nannocystis]MCY1056285.1 polyhydroxyalkanoic acid system family protein [Nannocystis sp. SCPEA4]MDC0673196.1 polyhydroxyalkanoic acid system family protein [Nannocystis radixulma]
MPKINLSRNHSLEPAVIKDRISKLGDKLQEKYQAKTSWADDRTLNVKGTGVEGKLVISANKVDVNLDLGFMLTPLKGKIEETLGKELEKLTAGDS